MRTDFAEETDQIILHKGERQLTYEEMISLERYLDYVKTFKTSSHVVTGACVMTCNPFTKGHYHLIEYASRQVELLFIFVVQEDAFFFSFKDRIEMVRRGVKEFSNVIVLPSGRFIISKETWINYFEKEKYPDAVIDAAKDVMYFRNYIVPALEIVKRFVGEEPTDHVTSQYNQLLKKELGDIIEVVEIPRKCADGEVISASKVRYYYSKEDWGAISEMVPKSTFDYLKYCVKQPAEHENNNSKSLKEVIDFILSHEKIVVCALGEDTKKMMQKLEQKLDQADLEKLLYYDKKAAQDKLEYRGRRVIGFEELTSKYKDFYMLISTSKYKKEIFLSLFDQNIDPKHMMVAECCG